MRSISRFLTISTIILSFSFFANATTDEVMTDANKQLANKILNFLDKGKAEGTPFQLLMSVDDLTSGTSQQYRMKDDGNTRTVLEFLDKRQRGQKILSTENDIWFFSTRTRRAIKIPPIQKLFGDASIGDVSRLRYTLDYEPIALIHDKDTIKLTLNSKQASATYHQIELWVSGSEFLPKKANLFAASGKMLKTVNFVDVEIVEGTPVVNRWQLSKPGQASKITQVTSSEFAYIKASDIEFTKSYLELKK
ncbi:outer membrane lipoprotein-sorting protein [Thalassotalea fusca]